MTDRTLNLADGVAPAVPVAFHSIEMAQLRQFVEGLIDERRARGRFFRNELFADPAWDILLVVFLAQTQQQRITVSTICDRVAVPATTAQRWITSLTDEGLLKRQDDPTDRRRKFIKLAPDASAAMCSYCWSTAGRLRLAA